MTAGLSLSGALWSSGPCSVIVCVYIWSTRERQLAKISLHSSGSAAVVVLLDAFSLTVLKTDFSFFIRKTRPLVLDGTCQVSCQPRAAVIQAAKPFISRCRWCPAPMQSSDSVLCRGEGGRGWKGAGPLISPRSRSCHVVHSLNQSSSSSSVDNSSSNSCSHQ